MEQTVSPGLGKALLINVGLLAVVCLFLLFLALFGISDSWICFLFLWYYASVKQARPESWLPTVCGTLFGFALSGLLIWLPAMLGNMVGFSVFLALIFVVVLLQVMGRFGTFINEVAFLFLTIGCIPAVQSEQRFGAHLLALIVGIVFWSALIELFRRLTPRGSPQQ
ncbi:hypothetical protein SAMN04515620_10484 [Collimonas sp. OK607]|uniref:hypothetical protein n=1 Tax=Collimonas sp. OK607 TaxID=1798194 RepID=UPI0008DFEFD4|nr:hypothetical protein [Collimonas sp. OK607]SFA82943.1 hypothetical protein SAMN04515620_10484 [Collimonas sp. OK607]